MNSHLSGFVLVASALGSYPKNPCLGQVLKCSSMLCSSDVIAPGAQSTLSWYLPMRMGLVSFFCMRTSSFPATIYWRDCPFFASPHQRSRCDSTMGLRDRPPSPFLLTFSHFLPPSFLPPSFLLFFLGQIWWKQGEEAEGGIPEGAPGTIRKFLAAYTWPGGRNLPQLTLS